MAGAVGLAAVAGLALSVGPARPVQANMMDAIIRQHCLNAVNEEIKASGKPAPAGMADYTCDCVVQQMKQRQSIDQAKNTCKAAAASKYNL